MTYVYSEYEVKTKNCRVAMTKAKKEVFIWL